MLEIWMNYIDIILILIFNTRLFSKSNQMKYIIYSSGMVTIFRLILNEAIFLYWKYPIMISILIILLLMLDYKLNLSKVINAMEGPFIFIIVDLLLFVFYTMIFEKGVLSVVTYDIYHTVLFKILVDVISIFILFLVEESKAKSKLVLNNSKIIIWLYFILNWIIIFLLFLWLQSDSMKVSFLSLFTLLVLFLSFFSIVIILIAFKSDATIEKLRKNQLEEEYLLENRRKLSEVYYSIQSYEHDLNYQLLKMKQDILEHKDQEAIDRINQNIFKVRKYKKVFLSGNPYFDQEVNKVITLYQEHSLLLTIQSDLYQKNIQINNQEIEKVVMLFTDILPYINQEIEIKLLNKFYFLEVILSFNTTDQYNEVDITNQLTFLDEKAKIKMNGKNIEIHALFDINQD